MKFEEKIKQRYLYSNKLNFFKLIYFNFQYIKSKFKPRIINANWAIDLIVENIFKSKKNGTYIDIGCHHPLINNNTYLLYKKGWNGINIDLDLNSIEMFNYFRPTDDNQKIAVSNNKGIANLYFFHNRSAINTLDKNNGIGARKIKKIKTDTLDNIILKSKIKIREIDFLTIDVEGNELKVLQGLNFEKYKPKVISIEMINKKTKFFYQQKITEILDSKIYKFLIKKNYKLSNWVYDDLLFVSNNFIKKK